jgi:benzoyl-CoA reductase/2-hydroxyglutaryl-CoA dehydratase subunit BcrC/BadD/HgdB
MLDNCHEAAQSAQKAGRPIVGILCEYTPRELILAAGALPVCLCGGSAETIPAAEKDLPAGLCPLIKSTYGYEVTAANPFLEMASLLVAETTCDGKKKMYELMARRRDLYVLELPQKSDSPQGLALWRGELEKFRDHLRQRFGRPMTDDDLRAAIALMNRERAVRRTLAELMARPGHVRFSPGGTVGRPRPSRAARPRAADRRARGQRGRKGGGPDRATGRPDRRPGQLHRA